jgi:Flp pilus assembly protein TadD
MSLVNDMLRDLEQRNKKSQELPGSGAPLKAAQTVASTQTRPSPVIRYLLWATGLVAIILTAWLLWTDQQTNPPPAVVKMNPQTDVKEPEHVLINLPEKAAIASIKWAGTEQGGDLVVRLQGDADIQLLEQDAFTATVAFDGVTLAQEIPPIKSPLVERVDLFRDADRIELTLTATAPSRFAFRIQHDPTTMILGVLPEPLGTARADVPEVPQQMGPVVEKPVSEKPVEAKPVVKTQPNFTPVAPRPTAPVKKVQRALTDTQAVVEAGKYVAKGKLQEALTLLQKRISAQPEQSAATRGYMATILLSMGERNQAQNQLQQGLQTHPTDLTLRKLQARLWLSEGKIEQTASLLTAAVPAVADDPEYHELLATLYQQQGLYEQAAGVYLSLLEYQNTTARWWVGMAYSLELAKRYPEARRAYQSALQLPGIAANLKTYAQQRVAALSGR